MSLIIASTSYDGPFALGADTGTWEQAHVTRTPIPKVFRVGRALVGLAGRAAVGQAAQLPGKFREPGEGVAPLQWAVDEFMADLRQVCVSAPDMGDDHHPSFGICGLVLLDGHVLDISDGAACVLGTPDWPGVFAKGHPADFARGAAAGLSEAGWRDTNVETVNAVLIATAHVAETCRAPFDILTASS